MLSPQELKNKEFSRSMRGYAPDEVDEHIGFIIEKYSELLRSYDELEKKYNTVQAQLDDIRLQEASIRSALINAQKAGDEIISEANRKSDVIMHSAKNACDELTQNLMSYVENEKNRLESMRELASGFKLSLLREYYSHILEIEKIGLPSDGVPAVEVSPDKYASALMARIRSDLRAMSGAEENFKSETDGITDAADSNADNSDKI